MLSISADLHKFKKMLIVQLRLCNKGSKEKDSNTTVTNLVYIIV